MVTRDLTGPGTPEPDWLSWQAPAAWDDLDLDGPARSPLVVLAAHPDDEVLGVGGLLRRLVANGAAPFMVWASDGEASHPGARHPVVDRLALVRRAEAAAALDALGVGLAGSRYLGCPDGSIGEHEDAVVAALTAALGDGGTVLAPWSGDGHPDHDACGRAAARAAAATGSRLLAYPVWMWHWAAPDHPDVPWRRARRVRLDAADRTAKLAAIARFASQVLPLGPGPEAAPVLPPHVVVRFVRATEVVFDEAVA